MLARTSLVFPILRLVTRPADSARSISRCTELTATASRAESSVRLASSSGSPSKSANSSPCRRDRRIGSRLGVDPLSIVREAYCEIREDARSVNRLGQLGPRLRRLAEVASAVAAIVAPEPAAPLNPPSTSSVFSPTQRALGRLWLERAQVAAQAAAAERSG